MTAPKNVAIFQNPEYDSDCFYTKEAVCILAEYNTVSFLHENLKKFFYPTADIRFFSDTEEMIAAADMVLILGGDGTMIDYSVRAAEKDKPAIGVNLGHLGFLTALERGEIEKLSALASGEFTVESRMLLDAEIAIGGKTVHKQQILNDIVIASGVRSKIADFSLSAKAGGLLEYRADGVIVATPTGSTAYSFSAGGPIIEPTASILAVTPICPHSLLRRSVLLSPETELVIQGRTRDEITDIHITMDGKNSRLIPKEAEIHIKKSPYTAKIIKIGTNRFYDILETKLNKK